MIPHLSATNSLTFFQGSAILIKTNERQVDEMMMNLKAMTWRAVLSVCD